jgi:hypothetical protein
VAYVWNDLVPWEREVLRGRSHTALRQLYAFQPERARGSGMAVRWRTEQLHHSESRDWRELARPAGQQHAVSIRDVGGLRADIYKLTKRRTRRRWYGAHEKLGRSKLSTLVVGFRNSHDYIYDDFTLASLSSKVAYSPAIVLHLKDLRLLSGRDSAPEATPVLPRGGQ